MRVAVVTEIIAPYRMSVFNRLGEELGANFKVFFMSKTIPSRHWIVPLSQIRFEYEVWRGFNVHEKNNKTHPIPRFLNFGVFRSLRRWAPTHVILGGYHHYTSIFVWFYACLTRTPLYIWSESTLRDAHAAGLLARFAKWIFTKSASGFLVPGRATEDYVRSLGAAAPIVMPPNPVDNEIFGRDDEPVRQQAAAIRRGLRLPERNMLFVGRLSPEKDLPTALEACRLAQASGLKLGFVIAGEGPYRAAYERLATELRIENTHFVGFKQAGDLVPYYRLCDFVIMPSISEPWGLVVNESLAAGTPVLCSEAVGAAPDLILEGQTGYVCSSAADFSAKIQKIASDSERLADMSRRCREHVRQFTPEQCAFGVLRLVGIDR